MKYVLLILISLIISTSICAQGDVHILVSKDSVLKRELETIGMKDQALRKLLPEVEMEFGSDSPELDYFWSLILEQDSINERELCQIIDNYGWLGADRVGETANRAQWMVIQHAPLPTQEKYLPLLKESVAKGESEGWCLALLEDRVLMRNGKKQIYGSQATFNAETGKMHIYPIANVSTVNERRKKIGLQPIEDYAKQFGYVFDPME